jgi:hypothetical protein
MKYLFHVKNIYTFIQNNLFELNPFNPFYEVPTDFQNMQDALKVAAQIAPRIMLKFAL